MCVPVVPLMIAATALSAAGSAIGGFQANAQGKYEAGIARNNAQLAIDARRDAIDRGVQDQVVEGRKQAQLAGAQRVALAGSGVDTTFGTSASLASDSALIGSENSQILALNANRTAMGYGIDASNYSAQAVAARSRGKTALVNGLFQAGSTILGGASQVRRYQAANSAPAATFNDYGRSGFANPTRASYY